jgi:hypothetical protein
VDKKDEKPKIVEHKYDREMALAALLAGLTDDEADRIIRRFSKPGGS